LRFLDLPEHFRDGTVTKAGAPAAGAPAAGAPAAGAPAAGAPVRLYPVVSGQTATWEGVIVRVESAIDESTRQITAVAQVNDPYSRRDDGAPPLRIGQFLEAEIEGETLTEVFVIPRRAVRAGNEILLITPENKLKRVTVEPILGDTETIVISAAAGKVPAEGDVLCLTPIPFAAEGAGVLPLIDGAMETTGGPGSSAPASGGRGGEDEAPPAGKGAIGKVPADAKSAVPAEAPRSS
jgi:hypothetical protein